MARAIGAILFHGHKLFICQYLDLLPDSVPVCSMPCVMCLLDGFSLPDHDSHSSCVVHRTLCVLFTVPSKERYWSGHGQSNQTGSASPRCCLKLERAYRLLLITINL